MIKFTIAFIFLSFTLYAAEKDSPKGKIDPCTKNQNSEECKTFIKRLKTENACVDDITKICFMKLSDKISPKNPNLLVDMDKCLNENHDKLSDVCKKSREKNKLKTDCFDQCLKQANNQKVDCMATCQTGDK